MLKRGCLISGGGSWGAYGGGTLQKINGDYDTVIGVSTGALLAPFVSAKSWTTIQQIYTTINNDQIFDKCWYKGQPFNKNGEIRKLPILMSLLFGHDTIYTTKAMRSTIDNVFSKKIYSEIISSNRDILVGTQNLRQFPSKIHYMSLKEVGFEDFKDWMWASASFPYYTSLINKKWVDFKGDIHEGQWCDGGITDLIGINELIGRGYDEIDVILHRTKQKNVYDNGKLDSLMDIVTSSVGAMRYDIEFEYFYDKIRKLNNQGTRVRVFWLPRKLSNNSMVFDSNEMNKWWSEGYETAFDEDRIEIFEPYK